MLGENQTFWSGSNDLMGMLFNRGCVIANEKSELITNDLCKK